MSSPSIEGDGPASLLAKDIRHRQSRPLAEQGTPGHIVEHGPTDQMFDEPIDPRTADYVNGRFG
ncbi:hypothetical protein ODJ79_00930 [Actinoplanes sp. KI2]|uniref:hypothetical protein n=1 Tax=Actinoplanes sp. KI2 TaxID=2983315 RepID=UPI0021D5974C|nr:hypothetical protein [Actinoplanes sp. KI2]MCU7722271.1 hypothetical protein [Actinoplanes sp. KI2]